MPSGRSFQLVTLCSVHAAKHVARNQGERKTRKNGERRMEEESERRVKQKTALSQKP